MKTRIRIPLLIAALLVTAALLSACATRNERVRVGTTRMYGPDPRHITVLGLTLGVNTIRDARDVIGPAVVVVGEYRHEPFTLCYRSSSPGDPTVLVVQTDFFGDWEKLTRFEILADGYGGGCSESPRVCADISTASGLKLGMSRDEVEVILGEPGVVRGDVLKYLYLVERDLTGDERKRVSEFGIATVDYDVITTMIEAEFRDGRLVRLRLSWSESV